MIPTDKLFVATIAKDARKAAADFGIGIEIDEFCTAANMDAPDFDRYLAEAQEVLAASPSGNHLLHAPFAELSPATIDPKVLAVVRERYEQAYGIAKQLDIRRMVVHNGYIPYVYMPEWYIERAVHFWRDFLAGKPEDFQLLIENVLEDDPKLLLDVVHGIGDPRAKVCLDIGHAFCQSSIPLPTWIESLAPHIGHVHLHNNDGTSDTHAPWNAGKIPMASTVKLLRRLSPEATFTVEMMDAYDSVAALHFSNDVQQDPARAMLQQIFGYDDFRHGQREVIDAQLEGRDVLGIMPTGAGKSICFQLPALLRDGITLVVSPLISLMKDQVTALKQAGVDAAYLNSSLTERQFDLALRNAEAGRYKLIYVAPERLLTPRFLAFAQNAHIAGIAVDEAHCISQWGQDFRPSYLEIPRFFSALRSRPPVGAFTATATPSVKADILRLLALENPVQVQTGFDRPNLYYEVLRARHKDDVLYDLLQKHQGENGIIYCATRKKVEAVCEFLQGHGISATRYHAGLSDRERHANQDAFTYDQAQIVVATNAFGMGIDKSNVRFIVHYNMPKDVESYYQEAGRAGRDGERADCILLYSPQDVITQKYLIEHSEEDAADPQLQQQVQENALKRLDEMVQYCRTQQCLRQHILQYFGEPAGEPCGNCGSCLSTVQAVDMTSVSLCILRCVQDTGERFGLNAILTTLLGKNTKRIQEFRLDKSAYFGQLANIPSDILRAVGEQLLAEGYLANKPGSRFPIPMLGPRARMAMTQGESISLVLPTATQAPKVRQRRRRGGIEEQSTDAPIDLALFEALRSLRQRLAIQQGVPSYLVFNDATLRDMCINTPQSLAEMRSIKGVGEVKLEQYGDEFLRTIQAYCNA